jgi:glycosyltransferase involved in cell wall biosynthesis
MIMENIVIIFCYNVERNIISVCEKLILNKVTKNADILFIDDCSTDNTYSLINKFIIKNQNFKIKIIRNKENAGYGKNYKFSINYVLEKKYQKLVFLHGDDQYPANEVNRIFKELDESDFCYGSRFLNTTSAYRNMPKLRIIANRILTFLINLLMSNNSTEYFSGFRGFRTNLFQSLNLDNFSDSWIIEQEMHLLFICKKIKIKEFGIDTVYEDQISRIPPARYVMDVIKCMIKYFLINLGILKK